MRVSSTIFSIIILSIISSCVYEEIIDEKSIDFNPILVVYSILSPDDSIYVTVTCASPVSRIIYEPSDLHILNARVVIKNDNGDSILLTRKTDALPIYCASQSEFPIIQGETYYLNIRCESYPSVYAETTIPENKYTWLSVVSRDILIPEEYMSIDGIEIIAYWDVDGSSELGSRVFTNTITQKFEETGNSLQSNLLFEDYSTITMVGNHRIFTKQWPAVQYSEIYSHCDLQGCTLDSVGPISSRLRRIDLNLITMDEHLNQFVESNDFYSDIWYGSSSFLNQFRGVIPEYTNIDQGLGVFGSYLDDNKTVLTK
jgi:hypothetical protein